MTTSPTMCKTDLLQYEASFINKQNGNTSMQQNLKKKSVTSQTSLHILIVTVFVSWEAEILSVRGYISSEASR